MLLFDSREWLSVLRLRSEVDEDLKRVYDLPLADEASSRTTPQPAAVQFKLPGRIRLRLPREPRLLIPV